MACIKLKALEQYLQELDGFKTPKVKLEQYETRPHIAARMLHTIQACFGDIEGKLVADLGCGTGSLAIGTSMLGAAHVIGFDVDSDALSVLRENMSSCDITNIDVILCDLPRLSFAGDLKKFDCVIMNPPFGTSVKGIDMEFLQIALSLTNNSVYSLHKTSTREHVMKKAKNLGVKCKVLAELRFDLPATYKFHKKESVDIQVDFIRFYY